MKPEDVQVRIDIAKRESINRNERYDAYLGLLTNSWNESMAFEIGANTIHSTVRQLVASTMSADPEFVMRPYHPDGLGAARAVTAYANYLWGEVEGTEQTELVVTDSIVYDIGYWRIGMGRAYQSEKELTEIEYQEDLASLEEDLFLTLTQSPVDGSQNHQIHIAKHLTYKMSREVQTHPEKDTIIQMIDEHVDWHGELVRESSPAVTATDMPDDINTPFLYRLSPRDVFTGGQASRFQDTRYLLIRNNINYEVFKDSKVYINKEGQEPIHEEDNVHYLETQDQRELATKEQGMGLIPIWELYDKNTGLYSAHYENSLKPARKPAPWPYRFLKGYPVIPLKHQIIPDHKDSPAIMDYMREAQEFDRDTSKRIAIHVKNASTKWILITDLLKNQNANKVKQDISNPEMDAVIEATSGTPLVPVPPNPIDPSFFHAKQIAADSMQKASGLSDPQQGDVTGGTATEVRIASGASGQVLNAFQRNIRKGIISSMHGLIDISKEWGPNYFIIPVMNEPEAWEPFKRSDLVGRWQIKVEMPLPGERQEELNNALNAYQLLRTSPNIQGEGQRRLEMIVLRRLGFETPELIVGLVGVDVEQNVAREHEIMSQGKPVKPAPGENTTFHLSQHNQMLEQLTEQFQEGAQQYVETSKEQQIPQEQVKKVLQQAAQPLQILQQHIEETLQLMPEQPQGRRSSALLFEDGNPGTEESQRTNEMQGT